MLQSVQSFSAPSHDRKAERFKFVWGNLDLENREEQTSGHDTLLRNNQVAWIFLIILLWFLPGWG